VRSNFVAASINQRVVVETILVSLPFPSVKTKNIHVFPRFDEFRKAVEAAEEQPAFPEDLHKFHTETFDHICSTFVNASVDVPDVRKPLNDNIGSELIAIRKEVVLSNLLAGTADDPYYELVEILRNALGKSGLLPNVSASDERWVKAIQIAQAYLERNEMPKGAQLVGLRAPEITFAQAIHFFSVRGIKVPLVGDSIMFESKGHWDAVAATVSTPMEPLGDTYAIQYLDQWLSPRFELTIQRMHLHPTPDNMARKLDRSLPYGHLYRLAIKMLGRRRIIGKRVGTQHEIGDAAKHFAALYEVEPFSVYELMHPPLPHRIVEVLRRAVQYDELFGIPQCEPGSMERLLRDLFEDVSGVGHVGNAGWYSPFGSYCCHSCPGPGLQPLSLKRNFSVF
jgi:hypothetical protein